jgi:hypothetical protein
MERLRSIRIEQLQLRSLDEIEDGIADRDTGTGGLPGTREHTERQILNWKVAADAVGAINPALSSGVVGYVQFGHR